MRLLIALVAVLMVAAGSAPAANAAAAPPPQMSGWFEQAIGQFETEAMSDVSMAPDVSSALSREWRSFTGRSPVPSRHCTGHQRRGAGF